MSIPRAKESGIDFPLFLLTVVLICFGIVMIYSSSHVTAMEKFDKSSFFLGKHLFQLAMGGAAMFFFSRLPYWRLRRLLTPFMVVTLALLVAVLFTAPVLGARRSLDFHFFKFMPSELAKFTLIIFLSHYISAHQDRREEFTRGFLPCVAVMALFDLLIVLQPDFSMSVITTSIGFFIMYVGCINILHLGITWVTGLALAGFVILNAGYRMRRVQAWLDPFAYRYDIAYHNVQSLIAVGSGGLFGVGLAQSREKYGYLPYQYNDYIFAIIGEELGFLGGCAVIGLFIWFLWRGLNVARAAPDLFGSLLAGGITFHICIQAFINMAVVLNIVPATGLPLPFISYAGSSLVVTMASVGILLNVSRYARKLDD